MQRHGRPPPEFIAPMLLRAGDLPRDERWALEVKFDGCRAQVRAHAGAFTLRTRPGRLCTDQFPELAALADAIPDRLVLDARVPGRRRAARLRSAASSAGRPHRAPGSSTPRPRHPPRR